MKHMIFKRTMLVLQSVIVCLALLHGAHLHAQPKLKPVEAAQYEKSIKTGIAQFDSVWTEKQFNDWYDNLVKLIRTYRSSNPPLADDYLNMLNKNRVAWLKKQLEFKPAPPATVETIPGPVQYTRVGTILGPIQRYWMESTQMLAQTAAHVATVIKEVPAAVKKELQPLSQEMSTLSNVVETELVQGEKEIATTIQKQMAAIIPATPRALVTAKAMKTALRDTTQSVVVFNRTVVDAMNKLNATIGKQIGILRKNKVPQTAVLAEIKRQTENRAKKIEGDLISSVQQAVDTTVAQIQTDLAKGNVPGAVESQATLATVNAFVAAVSATAELVPVVENAISTSEQAILKQVPPVITVGIPEPIRTYWQASSAMQSDMANRVVQIVKLAPEKVMEQIEAEVALMERSQKKADDAGKAAENALATAVQQEMLTIIPVSQGIPLSEKALAAAVKHIVQPIKEASTIHEEAQQKMNEGIVKLITMLNAQAPQISKNISDRLTVLQTQSTAAEKKIVKETVVNAQKYLNGSGSMLKQHIVENDIFGAITTATDIALVQALIETSPGLSQQLGVVAEKEVAAGQQAIVIAQVPAITAEIVKNIATGSVAGAQRLQAVLVAGSELFKEQLAVAKQSGTTEEFITMVTPVLQNMLASYKELSTIRGTTMVTEAPLVGALFNMTIFATETIKLFNDNGITIAKQQQWLMGAWQSLAQRLHENATKVGNEAELKKIKNINDLIVFLTTAYQIPAKSLLSTSPVAMSMLEKTLEMPVQQLLAGVPEKRAGEKELEPAVVQKAAEARTALEDLLSKYEELESAAGDDDSEAAFTDMINTIVSLSTTANISMLETLGKKHEVAALQSLHQLEQLKKNLLEYNTIESNEKDDMEKQYREVVKDLVRRISIPETEAEKKKREELQKEKEKKDREERIAKEEKEVQERHTKASKTGKEIVQLKKVMDDDLKKIITEISLANKAQELSAMLNRAEEITRKYIEKIALVPEEQYLMEKKTFIFGEQSNIDNQLKKISELVEERRKVLEEPSSKKEGLKETQKEIKEFLSEFGSGEVVSKELLGAMEIISDIQKNIHTYSDEMFNTILEALQQSGDRIPENEKNIVELVVKRLRLARLRYKLRYAYKNRIEDKFVEILNKHIGTGFIKDSNVSKDDLKSLLELQQEMLKMEKEIKKQELTGGVIISEDIDNTMKSMQNLIANVSQITTYLNAEYAIMAAINSIKSDENRAMVLKDWKKSSVLIDFTIKNIRSLIEKEPDLIEKKSIDLLEQYLTKLESGYSYIESKLGTPGAEKRKQEERAQKESEQKEKKEKEQAELERTIKENEEKRVKQEEENRKQGQAVGGLSAQEIQRETSRIQGLLMDAFKNNIATAFAILNSHIGGGIIKDDKFDAQSLGTMKNLLETMQKGIEHIIAQIQDPAVKASKAIAAEREFIQSMTTGITQIPYFFNQQVTLLALVKTRVTQEQLQKEWGTKGQEIYYLIENIRARMEDAPTKIEGPNKATLTQYLNKLEAANRVIAGKLGQKEQDEEEQKSMKERIAREISAQEEKRQPEKSAAPEPSEAELIQQKTKLIREIIEQKEQPIRAALQNIMKMTMAQQQEKRQVAYLEEDLLKKALEAKKSIVDTAKKEWFIQQLKWAHAPEWVEIDASLMPQVINTIIELLGILNEMDAVIKDARANKNNEKKLGELRTTYEKLQPRITAAKQLRSKNEYAEFLRPYLDQIESKALDINANLKTKQQRQEEEEARKTKEQQEKRERERAILEEEVKKKEEAKKREEAEKKVQEEKARILEQERLAQEAEKKKTKEDEQRRKEKQERANTITKLAAFEKQMREGVEPLMKQIAMADENKLDVIAKAISNTIEVYKKNIAELGLAQYGLEQEAQNEVSVEEQRALDTLKKRTDELKAQKIKARIDSVRDETSKKINNFLKTGVDETNIADLEALFDQFNTAFENVTEAIDSDTLGAKEKKDIEIKIKELRGFQVSLNELRNIIKQSSDIINIEKTWGNTLSTLSKKSSLSGDDSDNYKKIEKEYNDLKITVMELRTKLYDLPGKIKAYGILFNENRYLDEIKKLNENIAKTIALLKRKNLQELENEGNRLSTDINKGLVQLRNKYIGAVEGKQKVPLTISLTTNFDADKSAIASNINTFGKIIKKIADIDSKKVLTLNLKIEGFNNLLDNYTATFEKYKKSSIALEQKSPVEEKIDIETLVKDFKGKYDKIFIDGYETLKKLNKTTLLIQFRSVVTKDLADKLDKNLRALETKLDPKIFNELDAQYKNELQKLTAAINKKIGELE